MKTAFQKGVKVRFNIPDGALAEIVGYEGEGFYKVRLMSGDWIGREQDDLHLASVELRT